MSLSFDSAISFFNAELSRWTEVCQRYEALKGVNIRSMKIGDVCVGVQWNPARIQSTGAKLDAATRKKRPCFLCGENRPSQQSFIPLEGGYEFLVNPFPILPRHFTIPHSQHRPQLIKDTYVDMMRIVGQMKNMLVFYNGPKSGASAPDHLHFQAGPLGIVPLQRDWNELYSPRLSRIFSDSNDIPGMYALKGYLCPGYVIISRSAEEDNALFQKLYSAMPVQETDTEPQMNILSWTTDNSDYITTVVLPRSKHRPECYFREGDEQIMVSPGAIDMGGLLITPREQDFRRLNPELIDGIIKECGCSEDVVMQINEKIKA